MANIEVRNNKPDNLSEQTLSVPTHQTLTVPDSEPVEKIVPHVTASVDQLEQIKQSISRNNGQVLAAMLVSLPLPDVSSPIHLGEFCALFNLTFTPDVKVSEKLNKAVAPMSTWLQKFTFSYSNLVETVSKINTSSNFNSQLNEVAGIINSNSSDDRNFRKLFG
jgi:hypothetical protein